MANLEIVKGIEWSGRRDGFGLAGQSHLKVERDMVKLWIVAKFLWYRDFFQKPQIIIGILQF